MAHAAVVSLMHTLAQIRQGDGVSDPNENQLLQPLLRKLSLLLDFLEESSQNSREKVTSLERKIRVAAYRAEDVIESRISDRLLSKSQNLFQKIFNFPVNMLSAGKYHLKLKETMTEFDSIIEQVREIKDVRGEQNLQLRNFLPSIPAPSGQTTMVGFAQDLMQIKNRVCDVQQSLQIVPIIGMGGMGPAWIPSEGEFLKLKFLLIREADLEWWRADSTHFPNLENLILLKCSKLVKIPSDIGEILTLKTIEIDNSSPSSVKSAEDILEEQRKKGNDVLEVLFHQTKERLYPLKYGIEQDKSGHFQRRETKLDRLRNQVILVEVEVEAIQGRSSNNSSKELGVRLEMRDDEEMRKASEVVSSIPRFDSVAMDPVGSWGC